MKIQGVQRVTFQSTSENEVENLEVDSDGREMSLQDNVDDFESEN